MELVWEYVAGAEWGDFLERKSASNVVYEKNELKERKGFENEGEDADFFIDLARNPDHYPCDSTIQ